MDLKDFISNTLTQIADGVQDAINNADGKPYLVNPTFDAKTDKSYCIRFDLSVESESKGGANIKVLSGGISERSLNRISFEVNMTLPNSGAKTPPQRPEY